MHEQTEIIHTISNYLQLLAFSNFHLLCVYVLFQFICMPLQIFQFEIVLFGKINCLRLAAIFIPEFKQKLIHCLPKYAMRHIMTLISICLYVS